VARLVAERFDLTVVTNALNIGNRARPASPAEADHDWGP
jgi:hypothetical protein